MKAVSAPGEFPARGETVRWNGKTWTACPVDGGVELRDVDSGNRETLSAAEWLDGVAAGVIERRARPPRVALDAARKGSFMRWGDSTWRVAVVRSGIVHLVNIDTDETSSLRMAEWQAGCAEGRIEMVAGPESRIPERTRRLLSVPIDNLPESMRDPTDNMAVFIQAWRHPEAFFRQYAPEVPQADWQAPRFLSKRHMAPFLALVAERTKAVQPGFSTFHRWLSKTDLAGGDVRGGTPRHDLKGPHARYMQPRVEQWLNESIDLFWLRDRRNKKKKVYEELEERIDTWNSKNPDRLLKCPSEPHVARYIREEVDQYVAVARRKGRDAADRAFAQHGQGMRTTFAFERVECDHTFIKIRLQDDKTGANLGYPWITGALDHYSRMPLAMHVNFENQSLGATFQVLGMVMTPKGFIKKLVPELDYEFPYGKPWGFFFDRGSDFNSSHATRVGASLNIQIDAEPVACPEYKGGIERWWRTLKEDVVYGVKGAARSGESTSGVDADGEAFMTYSEFVRRLWLWATMVYAKSYHRGIDDVPLLKLRRSMSENLPRAVPSKDDLTVLLTRVELCKVSTNGVTWNSLTWVSPALTRIMSHPSWREGMKVGVRIDEYDVSKAWVIDPFTRRNLPLRPAIMPYMDGLSLHVHNVVGNNTGKHRPGEIDGKLLQKTKKRLRDQEAALFAASARTGKQLSSAVTKFSGIGQRAPSGDDTGDILPEFPEAGVDEAPAPPHPAPAEAEPQAPAVPLPRPKVRKFRNID